MRIAATPAEGLRGLVALLLSRAQPFEVEPRGLQVGLSVAPRAGLVAYDERLTIMSSSEAPPKYPPWGAFRLSGGGFWGPAVCKSPLIR
jgi:hypothetical protein